jgi:hypothetical protein
MPLNLNPRAKQLLEWHGHDRGGVHVPFQASSNPLGETIPTSLVLRLRELAKSIAATKNYEPRWIFLVGGPGNGKSETVQDFLSQLDSSLGLNGALTDYLSQRFGGGAIVPRKVEVQANNLPGSPKSFAENVGRLIVVQDATASEDPMGNAARELADDIVDLLTAGTQPIPVFIACANRGLLSRALREAYINWGGDANLTKLIVDLIRATSLGTEALSGRPTCWPLGTNARVACWPLDLESLLVGPAGATAFDHIFAKAAADTEWEIPGRCLDCNAREVCPFRQNAEWLRTTELREKLRVIVRRGELATGQRWNFRDLFSLVAELIVGQWTDFEGNDHPCAWVHKNAQLASVSAAGAIPVTGLVDHLYPHVLFRNVHSNPGEDVCRTLLDGMSQPISREVVCYACSDEAVTSTPIRAKIAKELQALDPAICSPTDPANSLRLVEDHFSQSIELGKGQNWQPKLTKTELLLLDILDKAEREWDLLSRDSTRAMRCVQILRRTAATFVKRSIGVRSGAHTMEDYLTEYEASLRDPVKLRQATTALQPLLGENGFRFNVVESFGQPQAENKVERLVTLEGQKPGIVAHPAPGSTPESPSHDIPSFEITGTSYRIPLTFDFYLALRLRQKGCAGSSLPASVRAAIDRVRHRFAGKEFRELSLFVDGRARVTIGDRFAISVPDVSSDPTVSSI